MFSLAIHENTRSWGSGAILRNVAKRAGRPWRASRRGRWNFGRKGTSRGRVSKGNIGTGGTVSGPGLVQPSRYSRKVHKYVYMHTYILLHFLLL